MTEPTSDERYIPRTAGSAMPHLWDDLPYIPLPVRRTARVLADVVGGRIDGDGNLVGGTQYSVGKSPTGLAVACIYVAELVHNREGRLSQPELIDPSPASAPVVRKHAHQVPALFLDNAGEEAQRLGDPVAELTVLREFREVEDEGGSFASLPRFRPRGGS